jgi:group I intron endonuclease
VKIYSIYKVTNNINQKNYIGFTDNFENRIKRHIINIKYRNHHFYNALKKYGVENFSFEIIYQSLDEIHCLKVMEPYFIKLYDSFNNGYNMTIGGEGCFGYKHTKETKKLLSEKSKLLVGDKNGFYNKKHTKETIDKNREKNIEVLTKLRGKKILQYDLEGNLVALYDSVRGAARKIGIKHYNQISKCCRVLIGTSYGYKWQYA